jgi:hypothetical protein
MSNRKQARLGLNQVTKENYNAGVPVKVFIFSTEKWLLILVLG